MEKRIYLNELERLKQLAEEIPNTRMMALGKVGALVMMNMRYERIMLDRNLATHPYVLTAEIVRDAQSMLHGWREMGFIESPGAQVFATRDDALEQNHRALFQQLWVNFSPADYEARIERYVHRLVINGLGNGWLRGLRCIDFGCGHGNFAHALVRGGATYVYGMDFGAGSIEYAIAMRDRLGVPPERIEFKMESVYNVSYENDAFDFAVQNGVFHHLEDEDAAIGEMRRVLRPGGWVWYYTDGAGGISHSLWDASVFIMRKIPHDLTLAFLQYLNVETGKRYHLGDGLNATYRHTTWNELTTRLTRLGFGNFRRLVGGFPTDFDHDVIAADRYGREKFGDGDLRVLAQKMVSV